MGDVAGPLECGRRCKIYSIRIDLIFILLLNCLNCHFQSWHKLWNSIIVVENFYFLSVSTILNNPFTTKFKFS